MRAYCLITVEDGRHDDVVATIKGKNLQQAEAIDRVAGTYDIVVVLSGKDPKTIGEVVINVIQRIDGVVSTVTLLAIC